MTPSIQAIPTNEPVLSYPNIQQSAVSNRPTTAQVLDSGGGRSVVLFPKFRTDNCTFIENRNVNSKYIELGEFVINVDTPVDIALIKSNLRLLEIESLRDDWNGNGAKAFSSQIIQRARYIVSTLKRQPFIFPTARKSIQMEYEKSNGDYLEFELFESGRLKKFSYNSDDKMSTEDITDDEMREAVNAFYTE